MTWPCAPTRWIEDRVLYVSIPFTWNLPGARDLLLQRDLTWDRAVVGGPAVELMPNYLADVPDVTIGHELQGVLQRVNPLATRTTTGCVRRCRFCAIGQGRVEPGEFRELADWPALPIVCDNNLLAASVEHFDRVIERLLPLRGVDFNQGLDARLMTEHHAAQLARLDHPIIRLSLDSPSEYDAWDRAFAMLRGAGIPKRSVRSYCLIGFDDTPDGARERCDWVLRHGAIALPMWFHALDQMQASIVTAAQARNGWTERERIRIMRWYYRHTVPIDPIADPVPA